MRVESTAWVEKERFLDKVLALQCKDTKVAPEEARKHIDGLLVVLMWSDG